MKSFCIKNMKSFVDSGDIEIAPLTVFVGRNSCGKSSLIRFPSVLAQTFTVENDSPIKFYGKMLDYGNYKDVIHGYKDGDISFSLKYSLDLDRMNVLPSERWRKFNNIYKDKDIHDYTIDVTISMINKMVVVKKFSILFDSKLLYSLSRKSSNSYMFEFQSIFTNEKNDDNSNYSIELHKVDFNGFFPILYVQDQYINHIVYLNTGDSRFNTSMERRRSTNMENDSIFFDKLRDLCRTIQYSDNPVKNDLLTNMSESERLYIMLSITLEYLEYISVSLRKCVIRETNMLSYIGPFRDNPERVYRDQEKRTTFVGTRGENMSTLLINDFHKNNRLMEQISSWLWKSMGYRLKIRDLDSNLFQIMLVDSNGFESNLLDVGYGISQVLPIVAEILRMEQVRRGWDKILIIEQPELHLHPAAQADLAELFVRFATVNNSKLLIETHSEHLIRKLQVFVADPDCTLTKDMVKIYYVDKKDGMDESSVEEMKMLDDGRFEREWPSGFFDKAFELSMELAGFY